MTLMNPTYHHLESRTAIHLSVIFKGVLADSEHGAPHNGKTPAPDHQKSQASWIKSPIPDEHFDKLNCGYP
jgi:hypothetical protein